MRLLFFTALIATSLASTAQWRIQLQSGPAIPLKSQSKDSLFFAKQGLHIQGKATYYFGHLGFTVAAAVNTHDAYSNAGLVRPPAFADTLKEKLFSGNGWTGSFLTVGPEFCFPYKKIKFQLGLRAGVALQKANATNITSIFNGQRTFQYANELKKKAAFAWQAEAGAIYFISAHLGLGITANLSGTKINAINSDRRFGIATTRTLNTHYTALAIAGSLVLKF